MELKRCKNSHILSSDQSWNNFDPKSKKWTFIDFDEDEYGYHLWDYESKKIIHTRGVIFNEIVMYKDDMDIIIGIDIIK